jgi:hypothetical protein
MEHLFISQIEIASLLYSHWLFIFQTKRCSFFAHFDSDALSPGEALATYDSAGRA